MTLKMLLGRDQLPLIMVGVLLALISVPQSLDSFMHGL